MSLVPGGVSLVPRGVSRQSLGGVSSVKRGMSIDGAYIYL